MERVKMERVKTIYIINPTPSPTPDLTASPARWTSSPQERKI